jgi:hypothetical protein
LLHRPILFVDVDGVISLFGFDADQAPPGTFHSVNGVLHCIGEGVGDRLLRLGERYELVWATGWEESANEHLPYLLRLPGILPYLRFDEQAVFGTAHWKLAAIERYAGSRPAAWIDDCHDDSCSAWAAHRQAPTLLIGTRSAQGLCDEHVDLLLRFADEVSQP